MKRILICAVAILLTTAFLQACLFRPKIIRAQCDPNGDFIDLGRIAFRMKFNPSWDYNWKQGSEIISVHYLDNGVSSAVNVASYTNEYRYFDIDWDSVEAIKNYLQVYIIEPKSIGLKRYNPYYELKIVKAGQLDCVRFYSILSKPGKSNYDRTINQGGFDEDVTYYCPVPEQPGKLPILVGISQSVGLGRTPHDLDSYMLPILESIVINPDPPENPESIPPRTEQPFRLPLQMYAD